MENSGGFSLSGQKVYFVKQITVLEEPRSRNLLKSFYLWAFWAILEVVGEEKEAPSL
ncbi:MAG: hypothetical protein LBL58_03565 [Tannerellaceae bacterium]|jgi:hypothetical protein|nr:hypothetical protein [Tannerellaceae bacterium]